MVSNKFGYSEKNELNEQQLDDKFSIKKILKEMEIDLKKLQAEPTIPNGF